MIELDVRNVYKNFGGLQALNGVNFSIRGNELIGLIGPNGAGKTTLTNVLDGVYKPSGGEVWFNGQRVDGLPPYEIARRGLGRTFQVTRAFRRMTVLENMRFFAQVQGVSRDDQRKRIPELLDLVGLTAHTNKKLREFSKGMLQRIGLAQALLNKPELVILDEPTSGLDPVGRRLVRDIIHDLRQHGTTVFLNSHFLSEVEITCDRVAFIKHGKVIRTSTLNELIVGGLSVEVRAHNLDSETISGLSQWCRDVHVDGENLSLTPLVEANLAAINRYLVERGVEVYSFSPQQVSLEDLFIQIIGTDGEL